MARNDGILLIGLLGAFLLLGRGKKKKAAQAADTGGFFEWKQEQYQNGRNGNGRTSMYVTTPYPVQHAVNLFRQAERELGSRAAVGQRTKKQVRGIEYGAGAPAYTPEVAPTTHEAKYALNLLDRS